MGNVVGSTCSFELRTSFGISHRAFVWSEEHWGFNGPLRMRFALCANSLGFRNAKIVADLASQVI